MPDIVNVGVLTDGQLASWQIQSLQKMLADNDAEITIVVVNDGDGTVTSTIDRIRRARAHVAMAGFRKLGIKVGLVSPSFFEQNSIGDIEFLRDIEQYRCEPQPAEGIGQELPAEAVTRIQENCDVLVRFGFGILQGDILTAPEYGVLSYHHGDIRRYRGRPAGFWEFLEDADVAGITLQKLSPELDAGEIVKFKEVTFSSEDSYQTLRNRLFRESIEMLSLAVRDIATGGFSPEIPNERGELYTSPSWGTYLRYLRKNIPQRLKLSLT